MGRHIYQCILQAEISRLDNRFDQMGKSQQEVRDLSPVRSVRGHGGSGRRAGSIGKLTLSMTIMAANFKSKVIFIDQLLTRILYWVQK